MTTRGLAVLLALALARPAAAEPRKLLVLQSEGRADAATRARIDAAVFKLATAAGPQAAAGELNFSDAATAVGCKPDTAPCKDEVLGMLAVDEIVTTRVTPRPGGLEVTVRRFSKGGGAREATAWIAAGAPVDRLDGIAPLFGDRPGGPPLDPQAGPMTGQAGQAGPMTAEGGAPDAPLPGPAAQPGPLAAPDPLAAPGPVAQPDAPGPGRRRLELAGMIGGGALLALGVVLWGAASSVQGDIDRAPTRTRQDLMDVQDLEAKGDGYAALGNLTAITGVVIGGLATYFFLKDRRATRAALARLSPTVLPHGAGVVVTFGAAP